MYDSFKMPCEVGRKGAGETRGIVIIVQKNITVHNKMDELHRQSKTVEIGYIFSCT